MGLAMADTTADTAAAMLTAEADRAERGETADG